MLRNPLRPQHLPQSYEDWLSQPGPSPRQRQWFLSLLNFWIPPQTKRLLDGMNLASRFETADLTCHYIAQHVPGFGDPQAQGRLDHIIRLIKNIPPQHIARYIFTLLPELPEKSDTAILGWVGRHMMHIDTHPIETQVGAKPGATRPLKPWEALILGLGKCTHLSESACFLLEHAGYRTRRYGVALHTFLEYQLPNGQWQLADPDVCDWGELLPKGLSMQALLKAPQSWASRLEEVITDNGIPYSLALLPGYDSNSPNIPVNLTAWLSEKPFIKGWQDYVVWEMKQGYNKWRLPRNFKITRLSSNTIAIRCLDPIPEPVTIIFCASEQALYEPQPWLDGQQTNLFEYKQSQLIRKKIFSSSQLQVKFTLSPEQKRIEIECPSEYTYFSILSHRETSPNATPIITVPRGCLIGSAIVNARP